MPNNLKWLLRSAQNVTFNNVQLDSAQKKILLHITDKQDIPLLTSNGIVEGSVPTFSLAGLTALQPLESYIHLEAFKLKIVASNDGMVVHERTVDLNKYCQYFGDVTEFPAFSITFDFGDHVLLDRQLADFLSLQNVESPFINEESKLPRCDWNELSERKDNLANTLSKNKESDIKSARNHKLVILNQLRSSLSTLESEAAGLNAAFSTAKQIVDGSSRTFSDIKEQHDGIDKNLILLGKLHQEKTQHVIKSKFLLEARQVKLLGDLQALFPITRLDNGEYAIRSLELGNDFTNNKDEDHTSSALGYVVHVVLLVSKYLEVPLRYQLLFMGSRSLIRDAVGVSSTSAYPLFKRGVEKERFEKALAWLKVDIEQLLSTRGVVYDPSQSMLYNLAQLFESEKCPKLAF